MANAVVVTRYGGVRHLALTDDLYARHFTNCRGTSSWTIDSWDSGPDHPMLLTAEDMLKLPFCKSCIPDEANVEPVVAGRGETYLLKLQSDPKTKNGFHYGLKAWVHDKTEVARVLRSMDD